MKQFHVRVAVVKALKDARLFVEMKDNAMQIPICRSVVCSHRALAGPDRALAANLAMSSSR
jgi:hypothetical protein